jgi:hypothetical protein
MTVAIDATVTIGNDYSDDLNGAVAVAFLSVAVDVTSIGPPTTP